MKQKLTFLAVMLAILAIPHHAIAQYDFSAIAPTGQTLYYTIVGSNEVSVTYPGTNSNYPYSGFSTPTGDLSIPSTVINDGTTYSVTSIGNYSFSYCSGLTSLSIPNSITSIGDYAFKGCYGLTSLDIPNSVTEIGGYAFYNCFGLTSLTIPNSVTEIGSYAFYSCSGLTTLSIPNSVTGISEGTFAGCYGLTTLSIPNSVTSIGDSAFYGCTSLLSLSIPNSVTDIGDYAFYDCSGLTSLIIPNSVSSIGYGAFARCRELISIEVSSGNTVYDSRENCNAIIETASNTLIRGCANTSIPNSVILIDDNAFSSCYGLTSMTIPNSVISIGNYAFYGCNLTSLIIPNSVTSIGVAAFSACYGLTSIEVSSGNTIYDSRENCNAIIEIASNTLICGCVNTVIPNSVITIGDYAFTFCYDLASLNIPNSITSIGAHAFDGCHDLTSLTIPNSVTEIGGYAFYDCYGLTSLTIPNSVTEIGSYAFYRCSGITSLTIHNSVTEIGDYAFGYCHGLTEINCHRETAPTLGYHAFESVNYTTPVNIPCGSLASYQSRWSYYFSNFNEILSPYLLDAHSSDEVMGSTSITTQPNCDNHNTAVIEATASAGYHFDHWSDGTTANPYTVQLTGDTTLIAYFAVNTGIDEIDDSGILVYVKDHQIHIDAAIGETVNVYTIDGRTIATMPKATEHVAFPVATAGVYLVKIGNRPAHKVVVVW